MHSNMFARPFSQKTGSLHSLAWLQPVRASRVLRCKAAQSHISSSELEGILQELPAEKRFKVMLVLFEAERALVETKDALVETKDALVETKDALVEAVEESKDAVVKLEQLRANSGLRLYRMEQTLATAMFRAGVTGGRSLLDFVMDQNAFGGGNLSVKAKWEQLLAADELLLGCIVDTIPAWARAVKGKSTDTKRGIIARNIATVHGALSNAVHSFVPGAGLTIYEGVPDTATSALLRCVCERNNLPFTVQKSALALSRDDEG